MATIDKKYIIHTIKKYMDHFSTILSDNKIGRIYLLYYLYNFLINNIEFINKHNNFKNAVIKQINDTYLELQSQKTYNYNNYQLTYISKTENIILKLKLILKN